MIELIDDDFEARFQAVVAPWAECGQCGAVNYDPHSRLGYLDKVWPCCQSSGHRGVWPKGPLAEHIASFDGCNLLSPHGLRTGSVTLCAALEAALSEALWEWMGRASVPFSDALRCIRKETGGRQKKLQAYEGLIGRTCQEVCEEAVGGGGWFEDWTALTKYRNDFAHGEWWPSKSFDSDWQIRRRLVKVREGAMKAAAAWVTEAARSGNSAGAK